MKDKYEIAKEAARQQMMREADAGKNAMVREILAVGKQIVEELEKIKPPTKRKLFWLRIKKVLGI